MDDNILNHQSNKSEGVDWHAELLRRAGRIHLNSALLQFKRSAQIYGQIINKLRSGKLDFRNDQIRRRLIIHRGLLAPSVINETVSIWIRDGWMCKLEEVVADALAAGSESSTLFVFLPAVNAVELDGLICQASAAQELMDYQGNFMAGCGQDTRRKLFEDRNLLLAKLDLMVQEILQGARFFKGGGSELSHVLS